jgi:hypothetical protein
MTRSCESIVETTGCFVIFEWYGKILPIWDCAKESLGERMDKHHNHESIFIKLLDFGIDVLLKKLLIRFLIKNLPH